MKTILHHFAYNITQDNLELVIELFEKMGCELSYRKGEERWCLMKQGKNIIQIIETNYQSNVEIDQKTDTHIGFLSDDPVGDIEEIKKLFKSKNINFRQGRWSDKELWFDLPDVFANFVIEIMHTSIVE